MGTLRHPRYTATLVILAACTFKPGTKPGSSADAAVDDGPTSDGDPAVPPDADSCVPPPQGLLAWWSGDGDASDVLGTYPGQLLGGASAERPGVVATAFGFAGEPQHVTIAPAPQSDQFTIEAWIDLATGSGYQTIYADGPRGFWLRSDHLAWWQGSERYLSTGTVAPGDWHHVALTYDGAMLRGVIDGVAQDMAAFTGASLPANPGIGGHDNNEYAVGAIDELAIYDRPLATDELAAIASAGAHGKCRP